MASTLVRQDFESAWPGIMPSLPLYGTINEEPDRRLLPTKWATVDYLPDQDQRISLGGKACWRERGVIAVSVLVGSGDGDSEAVSLVDQVRDGYRDWRNASGDLWIHQSDPSESGPTSDGRWYLATTTLHYQYDRVI